MVFYSKKGISVKSRVLIIIPAFNESETIRQVVEQLQEHVPNYDIVVVDDGSLDDTAHIVTSFKQVTLLPLPFNLGIGGAMQTGYIYALRKGYDIAVQCDADGQHPAHQIQKLVDRVENGVADLLIGSRYVADSDYVPSIPRRVGKSILSRLIDAMIGGGITDTTSGFRAANRKVISLFAQHYPEDYPEPETLVILHKAGLTAAEVPVRMRPRQGGMTSISPRNALYYMVKVGLAIFVDAFRKFTHTMEGF